MGRRVRVFISLIIFTVSLLLLYNLEQEYQLSDIVKEVKDFSFVELLCAALLTVGSYSLLTLYDYIAVRNVDKEIPYRKIVPISF